MTATATLLEVVTRAAPWPGGVEAHVGRLSAAMVRPGVRVVVATHATTASDGVRASAWENDDGVEYVRFRLPVKGKWEIPSLQLLRDVRRRAKTATAVHLHQYHQPLAFFAALALRGVRTPVLVTPHYHGTGHTPFAALLHRVWRPTAGRFLMASADTVIAVSDPEADLLLEHFPFLQGRVHVVPNGIVPPAEATAADVPPGTRVILSVGRLEAYKRNDALIRGLAELDGEALLVLVGAGPDEGRLRELAARLGVLDRVLITGRLDDETLASWWARADVFVSLSEQEAFGIALGEAVAAGVPAVVSDIPAFRYVAGLALAHHAPTDAIRFAAPTDIAGALLTEVPRFAGVTIARWEAVADSTLRLAISEWEHPHA